MRLWYNRWWRLLPLLGLALLLLYFMLDSYFISCGLRSCTSSSFISSKPRDDMAPAAPQTHLNLLSDLNGIEICLSLKFVEPIQRLELNGSPQLGMDGPYYVVYDYLKSSRFYGINETVTYTTHSTPDFMENIGAVAERWDGPVSVALYVPSTDFCRAVHKMIYLRNCGKAAYREKVTWHLFWRKDSPPPSSWKQVPDETHIDCNKLATDYRHNEDLRNTWRSAQKLSYPVNVARNIARKASTTWFVLPSDVELYPSLGLATQFMHFIRNASGSLVKQAFTSNPLERLPNSSSWNGAPRVFVVPVFEVQKTLPDTKEELMIQYARRAAVYFHRLVCPHCQKFPGLKEWISKPGSPGTIKAASWCYRHRPYHRWEPIFVCSAMEPLYDERLSWEGLQDKMTQMHELCLRGYQFHVLDRAFLVHAAGIKRRKKGQPAHAAWRRPFINENTRIYDNAVQEMENALGRNDKCERGP